MAPSLSTFPVLPVELLDTFLLTGLEVIAPGALKGEADLEIEDATEDRPEVDKVEPGGREIANEARDETEGRGNAGEGVAIEGRELGLEIDGRAEEVEVLLLILAARETVGDCDHHQLDRQITTESGTDSFRFIYFFRTGHSNLVQQCDLTWSYEYSKSILTNEVSLPSNRSIILFPKLISFFAFSPLKSCLLCHSAPITPLQSIYQQRKLFVQHF